MLDHCSPFFSSRILTCSAVLVYDSEFFGLSFLINFSLNMSPFPVLKLWHSSHQSQSKRKLLVLTRLALKTLLISSSLFLSPLLCLQDKNVFATAHLIWASFPEDLLDFSVSLMYSVAFSCSNHQQVFDKLVVPTHGLQYYTSSLKMIKLLSVFFAGGQDFTCFAIQHRS